MKLFAKKDDGEGARGDELNAFLGAGIEYRGRLEFVGTVRIDGRFHGEIVSSGTLVLGREAEVHAQIRVNSLFSSGRIQGDVEVQVKTVLHSSAVLVGSLQSKALVIEEGARVEGQVSVLGQAPAETGVLAGLDLPRALPGDEEEHLIEPVPVSEKTM